MPTKTKKTVPVKNLRKAIQDGMSYEEAAEHALESLRLGGRDDEGPFQDMGDEIKEFVAEFLQFLVKENDHSIRFTAKDDCDGRGSWVLECNHPKCPLFENLYDTGNCMYPSHGSGMDEWELNKFILDFYGIKKHTERKLTKKEARAKAKQIRALIAGKQKIHRQEIKALEAELKKLAKIT